MFEDVPQVTADSTDEEIIAAITVAGNVRPTWRKHDWPDQDDSNQKLWVRPNDIGYSSRTDPSLLKRLRKMVQDGLLEEMFQGLIHGRRGSHRVWKKGPPRFRALPKGKNT